MGIILPELQAAIDTGMECSGIFQMRRDANAVSSISAWLQERNYHHITQGAHGDSAYTFDIASNNDFPLLLRVAPYWLSKWKWDTNRVWCPLTVQPLERIIVPIADDNAISGDAILVEVLPKLKIQRPKRKGVDFDERSMLRDNTGMKIFLDKDIGFMADGTPVYMDVDSVVLQDAEGNLLTDKTLKNLPWEDPAWRQNLMKTIHQQTQTLGLPHQWVVERDGIFYSKQEILYGPDYLTRHDTHARATPAAGPPSVLGK